MSEFLSALLGILVVVEGGAIALLVVLRMRDDARIIELSRMVLALHEEFRARTGTEIVVDRQLLGEPPDVVAVQGSQDEEEPGEPESPVAPWGYRR